MLHLGRWIQFGECGRFDGRLDHEARLTQEAAFGRDAITAI
jgi:hypothetical protein